MVINCEIRVVIYTFFELFGSECFRKEQTKFPFTNFSKRTDGEK